MLQKSIAMLTFMLVITSTISLAAQTDSAHTSSLVTIFCFGDSITHGYPYGTQDPLQAIEKTYPLVLQSKLDRQFGVGHYTVVNHGINGLKAEELRSNLQTQGWLNENPTVALVMIGGNDLASAKTINEFMLIAQETVREVQDCVDIIKAHVNPDGRPPTVIVSAFPPNRLGVLANKGIMYYNALLKGRLTNIDLFFSDNFDDLYDSATGQAKSELMYDPVHPNEAGYAALAKNWDKAVLRVIKSGYSSDRLLVRFKAVQKAEAGASKHGARVERFYGKVGIHLVALPPNLPAKDALERFIHDPDVDQASLDYLVQADVIPNDPRFGELWGLHNTGQTGGTGDADIDAPEAWDVTRGSSSIVVGVIDTGVDYNHEDLAANTWVNSGEIPRNGIDDDGNGYVDDVYGVDAYNHDSDPMDDNNHGTHVAGTIGAAGGNGIGVVGVNWQVRIVALKFLGAGGSGYTSGAIECINYAITMKGRGVNIRILSNSWGGGGFSSALKDAIQAAANADILFVAAAGNNALSNDATPHYPSSYDVPNVLAVASTDRNDQLSSFSNYGLTTVDVAAPGSNVFSTIRNNQYAYYSGTSMATPHVSGVGALILASNPTMSYQQVKKLILFSSDSLPSLSNLVLTGGRVNANNALRRGGTNLRIFRTMTVFSVWRGDTLRLEVMAGLYAAPVPSINVMATFSDGSPNLTLRDDGVAPDTTANDGMFTASWTPGNLGSVVITFTASAPGLTSATTTVSGVVTYTYELVLTSYNWIEISGTGTALELSDDSVTTVSLPMNVRFWGQSFASLTVSSNGFISFSNQDAGWTNKPMPVTGLSNLLAVFWDDLIGKPAINHGAVYWQTIGTAPTRQLVVEWKDYAHYDYPSHPGSVTFEVILNEDSENVLMQYQSVSFGDPRFNGGASATIGIQLGSSSAVQYSYNNPNAVTDRMAILARPLSTAVTITSTPTGSGFVKVDGTTINTPQTFAWAVGSQHTLEAISTGSGGTGIRYVWTSWSDGGTQSHQYTVPDSSQTVTATYTTQYYLTVNSAYDSPTGAGWYNSGSSAPFSVTSPASGGTGTQHLCTGYSGDASGPGTSGSVIMDRAKTVTFNWKTQYFLTVNTYPNGLDAPTGQGWYDGGASASVSVSEVSGRTFQYWYLDGQTTVLYSSNLATTVPMNGVHTITAYFKAISTITLAVSTASFNYGELTTLSGSISPARAAATVTLSYSLDGGSGWVPFMLVKSGADGSFSAVWRPPYPATYRVKASWDGDSDYSGATSAEHTVSVSGAITPQPRLQLILDETTLSRGEVTTLTVTVYNVVETVLQAELYIEIVGPSYRYYDSAPIDMTGRSEASHHFEWHIPDSVLNGTYRISTGLVPPILCAYDDVSVQLE